MLLSLECAESVSRTRTRFKEIVVKKIENYKKLYYNQTTSVSTLVLGNVSTHDHPTLNKIREKVRETEIYTLERHGTSIVISLLGMVLFHSLGGRSLSFVPSNVRNLGAFARTRVIMLTYHR